MLYTIKYHFDLSMILSISIAILKIFHRLDPSFRTPAFHLKADNTLFGPLRDLH